MTSRVNTQEKVTFDYKHKKAYRGQKTRKGRGSNTTETDITSDYPLHWYDKLCYSVLERKTPLNSDIRKVQFFAENEVNWWSFQNVVDEQRKLLKAVYESALVIGGASRLHAIHYYFDTNNDVTLTVEYYVTEENPGPSDEYIISRLHEEIRKRYEGLKDLLVEEVVKEEVVEEKEEAVSDEKE